MTPYTPATNKQVAKKRRQHDNPPQQHQKAAPSELAFEESRRWRSRPLNRHVGHEKLSTKRHDDEAGYVRDNAHEGSEDKNEELLALRESAEALRESTKTKKNEH